MLGNSVCKSTAAGGSGVFASKGGGGGCVEGWERVGFSEGSYFPKGGLRLGCSFEEDSGRWYAIYVRSRHEKVVEAGLRGKGYTAFSPFYRVKRKKADRIAEVDVALFPSYVFCNFDATKRLPILMTPGIVGVVGPGGKPEPVDETEIASIRTLALSGRPVQPWPFFNSGQRVRVQAGPLMGAEGVFLGIKDEYHLIVSISLLQRAVSVVLEKDEVAPSFEGDRYAKIVLES